MAKLSFNQYGSLVLDGGFLPISTLKDILDIFDIEHSLKLAPEELRKDNPMLAGDVEKAENKREIFRIMLNHGAIFKQIGVDLQTKCGTGDKSKPFEIVASWYPVGGES